MLNVVQQDADVARLAKVAWNAANAGVATRIDNCLQNVVWLAANVRVQRPARRVAGDLGFPLQEGVYMCLAGPTFETPADIRFLRSIGADAVGMSTVPEVTVARHGGTRVLGVSGISNVAISDPSEERETTHEEVLEAGKVIVPRLVNLLKGILRELPPV